MARLKSLRNIMRRLKTYYKRPIDMEIIFGGEGIFITHDEKGRQHSYVILYHEIDEPKGIPFKQSKFSLAGYKNIESIFLETSLMSQSSFVLLYDKERVMRRFYDWSEFIIWWDNLKKKKNEWLHVRLSKEEKKQLLALAKFQRIKVGELIRSWINEHWTV